jgi:hypothetical protein
MEVHLAVGTVHPDDQVEGRGWGCHIGVLWVEGAVRERWISRGLDPATPI